jgi:integrase
VRGLERKHDAGVAGKAGRVRTVKEILTRHLAVVLPQRGRAPLTIRSYESLCREHIYPLWGGQRIDRLLPEHIEDGYGEMLAAGLAASSVRKVHAILSSAYEIEVKRGNVARNPCRLVEAPRAGQADKAALNAEQARAVLTAVKKRRNASRWSVGLACGLRQGEALDLRWAFTDLDAGETQIWWQLQRLPWRHGCADVAVCTKGRHRRPCPRNCPKAARKSGRRHVCIPADAPRLCKPGCAGHAAQCPKRTGGGLLFREIKERRRKTVPLPPELVTALKKHRAAEARERLAAANIWEDHDLVWCQENGRPIDSRADWQEWADVLEAAGLPHHGVHAMRHSAATIALDEGVTLAVVQELLGHSDIRVTREYTHVSSPLAHDGAQRLGKALFGRTATKTATRRHER